MKHILFCPHCKSYTLKGQCNGCSSKTIMPKPAKYGPEDPYAAYRRKAKEGQLKAIG